MLEATLDNFSYWNLVWTLSLFPFLGISFLFLVEKWLLSSPNNLPWMGDKTGFFPRISACLRDRGGSVSGLKAGYSKVSSSFSFLSCCLEAAPNVHSSAAMGNSLLNRIYSSDQRLWYPENIFVGS